jgi:hypothetical protein
MALLTFASTRLYFSERLGRYSDKRPSLKLKTITFPLIFLQIIGPLVALIMFTAYQKAAVFILVALTMFSSFLVLRFIAYKNRLSDDNEYSYTGQLSDEESKDLRQRRDRDKSRIFYGAVFRYVVVRLS